MQEGYKRAASRISKKKGSGDFKPHWMYDPKTGKRKRAKKPEDHERLSALGWGHKPPKK
tara:strand:+ start:1054 stop:1230 length:177 start_codon:yes stop_codon:yes gene_type:complete